MAIGSDVISQMYPEAMYKIATIEQVLNVYYSSIILNDLQVKSDRMSVFYCTKQTWLFLNLSENSLWRNSNQSITNNPS